MMSAEDSRVHDVIVAGNGLPGLSLGVVLARRGVRVAVAGRPHRPGAAGAVLGVFGEVTTTLVKSEFGRAKLDWAYQASKLWPEWLASLSPDSDGTDLLTADGTVVVLNTVGLPDVDTANFKAIRGVLTEYGERFEDVDPEDVDWLDPEPTARPLRAMFLPHEHAVNAHELLVRLERAFLAAGGVLITEQVTRVAYSESRVQGVELESGTTLSAGHVVLAAGVDSQAVLDTVPEQAAQIPRLVNACGVSTLVDTEDGSAPRSVIRTPNRAFASGAYVLPQGDGQVHVGATEVVSAEPRDTAPVADVLHLLNSAARQIRRGVGESGVRDIQVDNRAVALDGMPLLGETELDGLWMMTGTYRDGVTLSPLLAKEMAALMLGDEVAVDLELFQPVRSPIEPLGRADVVAATVTHLMATGYESNWAAPVEWPGLLEATLVTELYRNPPEILSEVGTRLRTGR